MKKRGLALLLASLLLFAASAYAQTAVFTDSLGRQVLVPQEITRVAVTGPAAQIAVFALAPDKLVGVTSEWEDFAAGLLDEKYLALPVLGQLYGGKGELNLETLLAADPQVVIDVGEAKKGAAQDLDALGEQTGIPFVHISADIDCMDRAYAMLGELLDMPGEAGLLGAYCAGVYARAKGIAEKVNKVRMLYVTGEEGLGVIAKNSYHSAIIDMLGDNLAVVDSPSSRGTGNEVDMEQILAWNPDVVVFSNGSVYDSVDSDPLWQAVSAVADGQYYEAPFGLYNWMGFPPGAQRLMGMTWLGWLLYPQEADYDLYEETAKYYELFYHCALTRAQFDTLTSRAVRR